MPVTRRTFLKVITAVGAAAATGGFSLFQVIKKRSSRLKDAVTGKSFCLFCSLHCNYKFWSKDGTTLYREGLAQSPVNRGKLCPKGFLFPHQLGQQKMSPKISYGQGGGLQEASVDDVIRTAVLNIRKTRDNTFQPHPLNSCESIGVLVGSDVSNEEAYLANKFSRLLGITDVGSATAIRQQGAAESYKATLGMSAQPNPWSDVANSDVVFVVGANPSINQSVVMQYLQKARDRGATVIVLDPLLSETAAYGDMHIPVKPGTDLLLLCGMINYALKNRFYDEDYIRNNTDASFLVNSTFPAGIGAFLSELKSGMPLKTADSDTWSYILDERGNPKKDFNFIRRNALLNILKELYSEYNADVVSRECGISGEDFILLCDAFFKSCRKDHSGSVIFGGGLIDSCGKQGVRALLMLQLLCGNIGLSGGGVYGLNSLENDQGVSDQIGLWRMLPGYLRLGALDLKEDDYQVYIKNTTKISNDFSSINFWKNYKHYFAALMRSWFGQMSPSESYNFLPKVNSSAFNGEMFLNKLKSGAYEGLILFDYDLLAVDKNLHKIYEGIRQLKWICIIEEKKSKIHVHLEKMAAELPVEVMILPITSSLRCSGTYTSGERIIQQSDDTCNKSHKAIQLYEIINKLYTMIVSSYQKSGTVFSDKTMALEAAEWKCDSLAQLRSEINGFKNFSEDETVSHVSELSEESVKAGNWIYAGLYSSINRDDYYENKDSRYQREVYPDWGIAWPENNRFLYNRAGSDVKNGQILSKKSSLALGDNKLGDDKQNPRPFYYTREGCAYFLTHEKNFFPLPLAQVGKSENEDSSVLENDFVLTLFVAGSYNPYRASYSAEENKLTAGEAVIISQITASKVQVQTGDTVELKTGIGRVTAKVVFDSRIAYQGAVALISPKIAAVLLESKDGGVLTDRKAFVKKVV